MQSIAKKHTELDKTLLKSFLTISNNEVKNTKGLNPFTWYTSLDCFSVTVTKTE